MTRGQSHAFPIQAYVYRARCERVIDGDTLDVLIDAGFHLSIRQRLRLLDAWCPEPRGAERGSGLAAAGFTSAWVARAGEEGWPLRVLTERDDAFGRYLALVWRVADGACLNDDLIASGHATVTKGGS